MNLLLVAPASGGWHHVGRARVFNGRTFRFSLLSLLTVAAETPAGWSVTIVDEQVDDVPLDGAFDLVGISCMTAAAPRAYEIAARFRARGIPVVLGGMHPTLVAGEALARADAVVVGEAEGVWPRVVADAGAGRLGGIYTADEPHSLVGLKRPPRHLLDRRSYATLQAVQATRGCPSTCSFCAVSAFHHGRFRCRPVEEVVAEVRELPGRFFIFVDDNLTADRDYARALFAGLRPLGKRWVTQTSLDVADDVALVSSAAEAGCIGLFVGLESFRASNLAGVEKRSNRVEEYRDRVRLFHDHGIGVEAGLVFGFDGDEPDVFARTLGFVEDLAIDAVQVSIMTPLPGTPQFDTLRERIFDRDWSHYDFHHAVFEPAGMSARDLEDGHDWITREFYRPRRIAGRLLRNAARSRGMRSLPYAVLIDAAYYGRVRRWAIAGSDPALRAMPATVAVR